jgi:hypothetical protein
MQQSQLDKISQKRWFNKHKNLQLFVKRERLTLENGEKMLFYDIYLMCNQNKILSHTKGKYRKQNTNNENR